MPQGKTDRPPLSPKRRPVVYKTNLTNRQQKELLSVQGTKVSRFIEYAKDFVKFLKRFLRQSFIKEPLFAYKLMQNRLPGALQGIFWLCLSIPVFARRHPGVRLEELVENGRIWEM